MSLTKRRRSNFSNSSQEGTFAVSCYPHYCTVLYYDTLPFVLCSTLLFCFLIFCPVPLSLSLSLLPSLLPSLPLSLPRHSDRSPIDGLSKLAFVVSRNGTEDDRLPSAHTCFNHLLLPAYSSIDVMRVKLRYAITQSEGFGLR
jgi:HECT-domain (ubiquitin-transferase)